MWSAPDQVHGLAAGRTSRPIGHTKGRWLFAQHDKLPRRASLPTISVMAAWLAAILISAPRWPAVRPDRRHRRHGREDGRALLPQRRHALEQPRRADAS